jgi:hypothetical protein
VQEVFLYFMCVFIGGMGEGYSDKTHCFDGNLCSLMMRIIELVYKASYYVTTHLRNKILAKILESCRVNITHISSEFLDHLDCYSLV